MRFLADENFNGAILRGLQRRSPELEIARAIESGLEGKADPQVLEFAAHADYVLLTQDVHTMPNFAYERIRLGQRMAGVVVVPQSMAIGQAIEDVRTIAMCSTKEEYRDTVVFLPL